MFKKKPQIKNLSPLRSSDRRKLADLVIAEFNVQVPSQPAVSEQESVQAGSQADSDNTSSAPTLSSIRASLVPENCLSARFTTHAGANATLISGTIYVGAHPGQEERILWLQYGKDAKLYPTVYTVWQNPGLVPLLHTQDFVVDKLRTGADLMTPGLVGGPPWPEAALKGKVVAVAGLQRASVPIWVGTCKIDISTLGPVQGMKGAAVEGIHWDGDEIWSWSQSGTGGRLTPERIEGWETLLGTEEADLKTRTGIERLELDEDDEGQDDGGVALDSSKTSPPTMHANGSTTQEQDSEPDIEAEREPTTAEVDKAFTDAFLYSVYNARKNSDPPHYGLDFPIQPSLLISNMIQPHLRFPNQHYTIKKTSWKNTKKFIKSLDKAQLVKSKDRNGGETVILDIDFDDQKVKSFTPYRLPKPKHSNTADETPTDQAANTGGSDPSIGQNLSLITVYRASAKLVPDLIPSKSTFYTSQQISEYLRTYISNNPELTAQASSKRNVKLDPFIANNILGSSGGSSSDDTKALAAGEIARDRLLKRVLDDDHLCIPHWILLRNEQIQTYNSSSSSGISNLKPKTGASPKIQVLLEKRTGTKTVTRISNLEAFFINPQILGPELQKKAAGSASVSQLVGGKPGMMEILVQGDQRDVIERELGKRGVDAKKWVEILDKTKKKGGGGK